MIPVNIQLAYRVWNVRPRVVEVTGDADVLGVGCHVRAKTAAGGLQQALLQLVG
jgi:hypothetical protein